MGDAERTCRDRPEVLVRVDGSEPSENALRRAACQAEVMGELPETHPFAV